MFNKTLVLVDTKKNIKINNIHHDLINIGSGNIINSSEFKSISIKKYIDKYFKIYRKKFSYQLNKKIKKNFINLPIDYSFLELFNFRNDKNIIFEKIILLSIIRNKLNLNKYDKIIIYFDDIEFYDLYSNFLKKKIILKLLDKKKKVKIKSNFKNIFKFIIKLSLTSLISKMIISKNSIKKERNLNISFFPILFFKDQSNTNNLNFIHTDDSHFSENYFQTLKKIFDSKKNKMINIEYFFKFKDAVQQIKNFSIHNKKILKLFKKDLRFENLKINEVIYDYLEISILNFFKMSCLQNSIIRANYNLKPNRINYFLFEYNFGFFLKKIFYQNNKKIKFYGFQHGIFNENLMWLDLIKLKKNHEEYWPQNIYYKYSQSKSYYKKIFLRSKLISNENKRLKENKFKISKSSNKNLIILGLHDYKEIINKLANYDQFDNTSNEKFICKIHPKTKMQKSFKNFGKNIKITKNLDNFNFKKIFISKYSTLTYDFLSQKKNFFIIHKNVLDYIFPKFLKNKMYDLKKTK